MSILRSMLRGLLALIPKDPRKVVFESHSDFCDNSRALYEYFIAERKVISPIWCVSNPDAFKDFTSGTTALPMGYPIFINPRSKKTILRWLFHIATAKTVYYSHIKPPFCDPKRQTVVCLWHGIPLKKISLYGDTPENAFTYLTTSGEFYSDVMAECFGVTPKQLVSTGFPRNDQLFNKQAGARIHSLLGIKATDFTGGIIVWMPTFRQHKGAGYSDTAATETGLPLMATENSLVQLQKQLEKNKQYMVLKLHPAQDLKFIDVKSLPNLCLLTNDDLDRLQLQLYHLLAGSIALLTDYSSVYFDYLLLDRPIGFIIDDIEEYIKNRGFVTDDPLSLMPGMKLREIPELFAWLDKIATGDDGFNEQRLKLIPQIYDNPDNKSCERAARLINY